jgi:AbrB family looped-hinge helix DNA binding protein
VPNLAIRSSEGYFFPNIDRSLSGKNMANTATLSAKFQISIPKTIRTALKWKAGQEFAFIPKGAGVMLVPVPERKDLRGLARGADKTGYRDREERY